MTLQMSAYLGNKTLFNSEWRIKWHPDPTKNHTRYIGLDKFVAMLWDVQKPQSEKDETLNNILMRLEESIEDIEDVKVRGRLRFKFHRAGF